MKKLFLSCLALLVLFSTQLHASDAISQITILSEGWEGATHEDGSGFYWDLCRLIYEPKGIKVNYKVMPYKRTVEQVRNKQGDAWLGSYANEVDFPIYPKWHYDSDIVTALFKKNTVKKWAGEASLKGKKVGWIRGYAYDNYLEVAVEKRELNSRGSALAMLQKGRIDFFVDADVEIEDVITKKKFDTTDYQMETVLTLHLYLAFANTSRGKKLAEIWDQRIMELHKSGKLKALYEKAEYTSYPIYNKLPNL